MASNPVFTVGNGVIDIPEELRGDPRLQPGARLQLVPSSTDIILHPQSSEIMQASADWRKLRGILKGAGFDLNDDLEQERVSELELEDRMWRDSTER